VGQVALIFPGQGSQRVGMGRDLASSQARAVYDEADEILGFSLSRLCFEGPEEALNDTANTQPALFVTSLALYRALQVEAGLPGPAFVAGHSLGELTALAAAGAMEFADGLRLVRERGRLMKQAGEQSPGGMAAVLKMDDSEIERACREASSETGLPVQIANYNAPEQIVISGHQRSLARAIELLRQRGARRIVALAVSIAAHSPLMANVTAEYRLAVDATPLRPPTIPVIGNVHACPLHTAGEIRDDLAGQLTQPVQWTASVLWMVARGVTHFVEVGPKDVLTRLVQRIEPSVLTFSVGDADSARGFRA
jgi:[acyl-carrier-protein] S-malonyltransferase